MTNKIIKITHISIIVVMLCFHLGILKEDGIEGYMHNLLYLIIATIFFFIFISGGALNKKTYTSLFEDYKVPPIPYSIYLGFFFIMYTAFAIMLILKILGIAFLTVSK